ncbi:MAG: protein-glutamate O-methyltransferase [Thermodesulfobacteriota bacterium]
MATSTMVTTQYLTFRPVRLMPMRPEGMAADRRPHSRGAPAGHHAGGRLHGRQQTASPRPGMVDPGPAPLDEAALSAKQFRQLAAFIQERYGIRLPPAKKLMVESRLRRRLKETGQSSLGRYLEQVFSPEGEAGELLHMVDAITTNKTEFFREADHFQVLASQVLPHLAALQPPAAMIRIWSAACSTGEEAYTLAMVLAEWTRSRPLRYAILASDLSTRVLGAARQAIYREDEVAAIPMALRKRYLLRSKDRGLGLVQIGPGLRERVTFRRINLMDEDFGLAERQHIIFCRNVMIYFDKEDQGRLMRHLHGQLAPGGFLFTGHSESLAGIQVPFRPLAPAVYQRIDP